MNYQSSDIQRRCPVCDAGPGQRCRALNQTAYVKPRIKVHTERRGDRPEPTTTALAKMRAAKPEELRRDLAVRGPHGTHGRYRGGCRCDECKKAHSATTLERRHKAKGTLAPGDRRHGTTNGYRNYACRCNPCIDAERAYRNDLRERTRLAVSRAVSK